LSAHGDSGRNSDPGQGMAVEDFFHQRANLSADLLTPATDPGATPLTAAPDHGSALCAQSRNFLPGKQKGRLGRLLSTLMALQAGLPILEFSEMIGVRKAIKSPWGRQRQPPHTASAIPTASHKIYFSQ
jgi:hypothetical protein